MAFKGDNSKPEPRTMYAVLNQSYRSHNRQGYFIDAYIGYCGCCYGEVARSSRGTDYECGWCGAPLDWSAIRNYKY